MENFIFCVVSMKVILNDRRLLNSILYLFQKKSDDFLTICRDTSSHGTKVAGIIAGEVNNSKCGAGIAYKASLGG